MQACTLSAVAFPCPRDAGFLQVEAPLRPFKVIQCDAAVQLSKTLGENQIRPGHLLAVNSMLCCAEACCAVLCHAARAALPLCHREAEFLQVQAPLRPFKVVQYDAAVQLWQDLRWKLDQAMTLSGNENAGVWKTFWSAHQRFFKLLCIDLKLETVLAEVSTGKGGTLSC